MSLDPYGSYQADVHDPLVGYVPPQAGPNYYGSGSPEGVLSAPNGSLYVDSATNDLYWKASGSGNTGWALVSSGGGGATEVYYISSDGTDPNGVITATRPAVAYDDSGNFWKKTGSGSSNTGWEQFIAAP